MAVDKVTFIIHTVVLFQGKTWEYDVEFNEDCCTRGDVIIDIERQFEDDIDNGIIIDDELGEPLDSFYTEVTEDMCSFDFSNLPDFLDKNWDSIEEFAETYYDSSYELDVFEAAHDCGIEFNDIDECYQGEYDNDEDFTLHLVDDMGDLPKNLPSYIYIDWERTARDIMYDYTESNGHYFRLL